MFLPMTRHGGHAESGDVEWAGLGERAAVQTDLDQGDGIEVARCGSLDKIALPLSVREPATAQVGTGVGFQ